MNQKGIKFVHDHSRPLHVDSIDKATDVIQKEIILFSERGNFGEYVKSEEFARHLAWVIGFDVLAKERKAIFEFTEKLVED